MKKLLLILLTLGTTTAFAQYGNNAYYGGNTDPNAYTGYTPNPTPTYSTGDAYGSNGSRIRWEASPCGTFRWRIEETSCWVPGAWVYTNGCRRWVDGYFAWTPSCRSRVYHNHSCSNSCGHQMGVYTWSNGAWSDRPYCGPRGGYRNGGSYTTYSGGYNRGGGHGNGYGHGGHGNGHGGGHGHGHGHGNNGGGHGHNAYHR